MTVARAGRLVLGVVAASAVVGAALGVLWWLLAPRDTLEVFGEVAFPEGFQPDAYAASDALAGLLCLVGGILVTVVTLVVARRSMGEASTLPVLVATVLGGFVGAVVLALVGSRLGSVDIAAEIARVGEGGQFTAPLVLRMTGVLILWPVASAFIVFGVALRDWWRVLKAQAR